MTSAEANVLHDLLADDPDAAREKLREFLPGELRALQQAAEALTDLCEEALGA